MRLSSTSTAATSTTTTLTTSLSRRIRRNGSLRGAQSPALFPNKNRGSSVFTDNPEPSSPKVTCIGQVRVKTKKQGQKIKFRACGSHRIARGEPSFRMIQHSAPPLPPTPPTVVDGGGNRNQKWVHLPFSICETLNCLLPCKSSCFSNNGDGGHGGGGSCGSVFRWFVSLEEGKKREIELVVGGGDEDEFLERERVRVLERDSCSRRRSIFDDMEFDDLFNNGNVNNNNNGNDNGDEKGENVRVSVCVPPKNALLLMRCRSDPVRMESLSRKFMEAPVVGEGVDDEVEDGGDVVEGKGVECGEFGVELEVNEVELVQTEEVNRVETLENVNLVEIDEGLDAFREESERKIDDEKGEIEEKDGIEIGDERDEKYGVEESVKEEHFLLNVEETWLTQGANVVNECSTEDVTVEEGGNDAKGCSIEDVTVEETVVDGENDKDLVELLEEQVIEVLEKGRREESLEVSSCVFLEVSKELDLKQEKNEVEKGRKSIEKGMNKPSLPDCLLLMMCEPKLSMEVSKETWVSSNDFVRWLPERRHSDKSNKTDVLEDQSSGSNKKTKPAAVAAQPPLLPPVHLSQPGRSSISFSTSGGPVANFIEQKLVKAGVGYDPFVLPRCKSAPIRSAAKFAQPELACSMWGRENGCKLEPHRPATCGVGAAEVGF